MIPPFRPAALLAGSLALAACASVEGPPPDVRTPEEKAKADKAAADEISPKGKAALYRRVTQLTDAWVQAHTGAGGKSAVEERSLGTAIAREVWERFDDVIADLKSSDNPRWRVPAARGLGFIKNPRVRPALEGALDDADASVLAAALVSLGQVASPDTDDAKVSKFLSFPDKIVSGNAALCLARVFQARRQQGVPVIAPARAGAVEADLQVLLFDTADPILRGSAAQALGELGSPTAEDALLNRVRDEHSFVRIKVAYALAVAGTTKGYDILLDSLGREQEKSVQTVTALALGSVAERAGLKPPYQDLGTDAAAWRKWLQR
jgi:hypothetical protein